MKPSNTGPWGCKCQTLHHRASGDGCDECNPDMARQIEIDNAVDVAIAEYRKELAAKVANMTGLREVDEVGGGFVSCPFAMDTQYIRKHRVLSLLNENDE